MKKRRKLLDSNKSQNNSWLKCCTSKKGTTLVSLKADFILLSEHKRDEILTVDANIDPPNHTAYLCIWWVMTCTSIGLGWGGRTETNTEDQLHFRHYGSYSMTWHVTGRSGLKDENQRSHTSSSFVDISHMGYINSAHFSQNSFIYEIWCLLTFCQ